MGAHYYETNHINNYDKFKLIIKINIFKNDSSGSTYGMYKYSTKIVYGSQIPPYKIRGILPSVKNNTIFINDACLYELLILSKKEKATPLLNKSFSKIINDNP